ncbi:MAG: DUF438 domain-containing protein [Sarcina sp.]
MKKNLMQIGAKGVAKQERILKLKDFLKRLNSGEITQKLKEEGMEIVKNINPIELSLAEQSLIEEGMDPSELRHLCDIHIEALGGELEKLKSNIPDGHVLKTLIEEHEIISGLLDNLADLNEKIQKSSVADKTNFNKLEKVSQSIINAEPHHQREEDILFIELEELKVTGPTRIMRLEHETLREKKHAINNMAKEYEDKDFSELKKELDTLVKGLCHELKDHIFKENYILYPTAFDVIKSEEKWDDMKKRCDKIGYCNFN